MMKYGQYGKPVLLFEAYEDWRRDRLELNEADTRADFPEFLYGPVRTSVWHGYERVQPQYRRYARIENMPDFRERRLRGLTGMSKPGYVGEHGEYPQMVRGERPSVPLVIDTYGAVYGITRHAIINDETSELLNSAPMEMGDASAEFIVETVIAMIESNPTAADGQPFFSATRGNQGTLALSEDALADAVSRMTKQVDDSGRRIRISVRSLVVGDPRIQLIANRIINSQLTGTQAQYAGAAGAGSNVFDKGTLNPLNGIIPNDAVIYDPYLSDANDWYLFADPARVPAFAVGFLNGQEKPQVFKKNLETSGALDGPDPYSWELDSVDFKIRLDFGVAAVDPRGAYRSVVA
jgi:hypothetical protein